tara:strand:- start:1448 stop:2587 length:1140 start_codon:yes stop_codon:yes gene_type:complete
MINIINKIIVLILIGFFVYSNSYSIETKANSAFVIDADSSAILFNKNGDMKQGPASMSKLMLIYMVFEKLQNGSLNLNDQFLVSKKAWKFGGSKMFVNLGDKVSIDDLLKGVVVQSGNDACIVLAEGLSGTEEDMVIEMNKKSLELGLTNSNFINVTGWPHNDHYMSLRDIAILSQRIIKDFPEYYYYFSMYEFTYNDIQQFNRNKLVKIDGYDGLKTGRTNQSGFGLAASALKNNRRIISVVNGLNSSKERTVETKKFVNWAIRDFVNYDLYKAGETIDNAKVWLGKKSFVKLVTKEDLIVTVNKKNLDKFKIQLVYDSPIISPIKKGDKLAELIISENNVTRVLNLYAQEDIQKVSRFYRSFSILNYLLFGVSNRNQ